MFRNNKNVVLNQCGLYSELMLKAHEINLLITNHNLIIIQQKKTIN